MYVTHLAQVMISTLPSSQHFTSYTVCVLTHCAPLGSNYFFETENICTMKRHLESGASIKKARNLLYNSLHFWLDSWRSSKKKEEDKTWVFSVKVHFQTFLLPSSTQTSNSTKLKLELRLALFSNNPATHPPSHPPTHPPTHPATP